jgi:hypothetical protein
MPDIVVKASEVLARRSSRRQLLKFMTASSLGAGLFFTRTGVTLGSHTACVGCGGGPCNPCYSPAPACSSIGKQCRDTCSGGGCPSGCTTLGEWYCCHSSVKCRVRCSECRCAHCCHCFVIVKSPCGGRTVPCPC